MKFIKVSTITFILFTAFGFLWHNNLFPSVYYSTTIFLGKETQNVWYMNFAMALLVYGMAYFFFKSIMPATELFTACLWGIYYNISVIGFFNFLALGLIQGWNWNILLLDMCWAVVSGAGAGGMIFYLFRKFK